jgi:hypothetical protein
MSMDEHAAGRGARLIEIDRHDRVDGFAFARVVFSHAYPALPRLIEDAIAVAQLMLGVHRLRRQRLGVSTVGALSVKSLILEIGEDAGPAGQ